MAILRYAIIYCDHEWRVVCERRRIGHYGEQGDAALAGARLAIQALDSGHEVEFLVQAEGGELVRRDPLRYVSRPGDASEADMLSAAMSHG